MVENAMHLERPTQINAQLMSGIIFISIIQMSFAP